jgi:Tol biopolymer transport system component
MGREAGNGYSKFDFSSSGTFVYATEPNETEIQSFSFLDGSGKLQPLNVPAIRQSGAHLSPDGTELAFIVNDDTGTHLSIYDLARNRMSRLADVKGQVATIVWSPDNKRLVFNVDGKSPIMSGIYWTRVDGAGEPKLLVEGSKWVPSSFTPDGRRLVYWHGQRPWGVWTIPVDFSDPEHPTIGKPETLLMTERETRNPTISPDGHWMGYASYDSGRLEVYVRPFPGPGRERQVSTEGAGAILWSPNGRELFYGLPFAGQIRVADYTSNAESFTMSQPRLWSDKLPSSAPIAGMMPDGKRFVFSQPMESGTPRPEHLVFLLNFFEELQRRFPTGK